MRRFVSFVTTLLMVTTLMVSAVACTPAPSASTASPAGAAASVAPTSAEASTAPAGATASTGDDGLFKVGLECAYAPFNWTQMDDSNGAVPIEGTNQYAGGYDIEIAKLIAKGLGQKLVIVKTAWEGLIPALQSNTIDAIIAGMSPKPDRRETIDFTDYYYQSSLVIVVKKGGKFENATSLADFAGAKITGQIETVHYDSIDQIKGVNKLEASKDFTTMRVALESGAIDGYVSEKPEGVSAQLANSNFKMVEFGEGKGFQVTNDLISVSVGLKKGSELTKKINEILAGITADQRNTFMENAIKNQPIAGQ